MANGKQVVSGFDAVLYIALFIRLEEFVAVYRRFRNVKSIPRKKKLTSLNVSL